MIIYSKNQIRELISEAYNDVLREQDDEWIGLSYRDVAAKLKELGVDPNKKRWWQGLPRDHEARRKFRPWWRQCHSQFAGSVP